MSLLRADLGPPDKLEVDLNKGSTLALTGVPVKVRDKRLIVVTSVQKGDQFVEIDRRGRTDEAQPAAQQQKPQNEAAGEGKPQQKQ